MTVRAKWKGGEVRPDDPNFEYINGVPTRDLEDDDWDSLTEAQQANVKASKLYDIPSRSEQREAAKAEKKGD